MLCRARSVRRRDGARGLGTMLSVPNKFRRTQLTVFDHGCAGYGPMHVHQGSHDPVCSLRKDSGMEQSATRWLTGFAQGYARVLAMLQCVIT